MAQSLSRWLVELEARPPAPVLGLAYGRSAWSFEHQRTGLDGDVYARFPQRVGQDEYPFITGPVRAAGERPPNRTPAGLVWRWRAGRPCAVFERAAHIAAPILGGGQIKHAGFGEPHQRVPTP